MFNSVYVLILIILVINIAVSIYLMKRDDLEPFQKGAQIVLIWLVPLFAAIGLVIFYRTQDKPLSSSKPFGGGHGDGSGSGGF